MNMFKTISFAFLLGGLMSCQQHTQKEMKMPFQEKYRPQYHFSPEANWMNDPNGMVYYEGEYHLFYQYYPDSTVWGPMHWGHAVSQDMVKWEHLPIALYPDSLGYIFSGSAVIDTENTAGFGTSENPAMVAIFTYHDPKGEKEGQDDFQYQGIAYSLDKGRTWKKYEGNPVLPNQGIRDFRDPKVSWNSRIDRWIMTLAVADHISFYSSPDLKNWTFESDFGKTLGAHGGVWECPDLFPLSVEGSNEEKWILLVSINPGGPNGGSATQYFVGQFDGHTFTPDQADPATKWLDFGADNYAGVTWSNVPEEDGRRLFLGWMSNWQYAQVVPTEPWRSAMTLPRELRLRSVAGEIVLANYPVAEMSSIVGDKVIFQPENGKKIPFANPLTTIDLQLNGSDFSQLSLLFSNEVGEELLISLSDSLVLIDRSNSGLTGFENGFGKKHEAKMIQGSELRSISVFVDYSSLEVFVNEGELVMTELVFPTKPYNKVELNWEGAMPVREMRMSEVNAIW